MNNFEMYNNERYVFGKGAELRAGEYVKKHGGTRVLIHYGGKSAERSGLMDRIKASLEREGLPYIAIGGVQPNPKSGLIYSSIERSKAENVDLVLAVGGGSVIDSSKAIAVGSCYDGDFWDFYTGKSVEKALPVGVVLTLAAAGSEGSNGSVVTHENGLLKRSCESELIRPRFAIMDPELLFTLPKYQIACGGTDIMAHVFERYFTNTKGVELTDNLCEAVLMTVIEMLPRALKDPTDYDAQANIMWAGTIAHNNFVGMDREQDWGSHMMEHELSGLYDVAHGAGLAVLFPAWMRYVYRHDTARFARLAANVWKLGGYDSEEELALAGIDATESFFRSLGMPTTFAEIGARAEDIDLLTQKALQGTNGTLGNFVKLGSSDIKAVFEIAAGLRKAV